MTIPMWLHNSQVSTATSEKAETPVVECSPMALDNGIPDPHVKSTPQDRKFRRRLVGHQRRNDPNRALMSIKWPLPLWPEPQKANSDGNDNNEKSYGSVYEYTFSFILRVLR